MGGPKASSWTPLTETSSPSSSGPSIRSIDVVGHPRRLGVVEQHQQRQLLDLERPLRPHGVEQLRRHVVHPLDRQRYVELAHPLEQRPRRRRRRTAPTRPGAVGRTAASRRVPDEHGERPGLLDGAVQPRDRVVERLQPSRVHHVHRSVSRSVREDEPMTWFSSPDDAAARLHDAGYLADAATATTAYLAGALEKPLLVEGPAGVGKTELAKAVARATGRRAGPAAVLRGPRRGARALRVELQEAAAPHPGQRRRRSRGTRPTTTSSPTSSC